VQKILRHHPFLKLTLRALDQEKSKQEDKYISYLIKIPKEKQKEKILLQESLKEIQVLRKRKEFQKLKQLYPKIRATF